jgi:predicted transcriptional regulator of viral defense system
VGAGGADAAIAELAERQHGVIARWQMLALGVGRGAIARRLERKQLHLIHRGVYAVGHRRLSRMAWWMSALLACGPDAVLSHRSAAVLWGILENARATVDISVPRRRRGRGGVRLHQAALAPDERTIEAGIPVTTVARTLLDLAPVLQRHELNRALERAEALRLSDVTPLVALMERHNGRRGMANLRAATKEQLRPAVTKSELERRFLRFVDKARLPRPETNVWLQIAGEWIEVDCVWPEQRVIVELDSRTYHRTTAAFERDRRRDRRRHAVGWRPIRVTDRALRSESDALDADLGILLSAARARSA